MKRRNVPGIAHLEQRKGKNILAGKASKPYANPISRFDTFAKCNCCRYVCPQIYGFSRCVAPPKSCSMSQAITMCCCCVSSPSLARECINLHIASPCRRLFPRRSGGHRCCHFHVAAAAAQLFIIVLNLSLEESRAENRRSGRPGDGP